MTIPISLNTISNLQDTTTAQTNINANSAAITGGFSTALNVIGDQMKGNLDMNSNQILNLPAPATANSPVRLQDVTSSSQIALVFTVSTVTSLPAGVTGARGVVTDATTTTFAATVTGGSTNIVPVYYTGSVWRIG